MNPNRLNAILDALAFCCVFDVRGQVVAVSASMTAVGTNVFVAQNGDVPEEIERHLEDMWARLCALSQTIEHNPAHPPKEPSPDSNRTPETKLGEEELR
jgi:hypothetical protein